MHGPLGSSPLFWWRTVGSVYFIVGTLHGLNFFRWHPFRIFPDQFHGLQTTSFQGYFRIYHPIYIIASLLDTLLYASFRTNYKELYILSTLISDFRDRIAQDALLIFILIVFIRILPPNKVSTHALRRNFYDCIIPFECYSTFLLSLCFLISCPPHTTRPPVDGRTVGIFLNLIIFSLLFFALERTANCIASNVVRICFYSKTLYLSLSVHLAFRARCTFPPFSASRIKNDESECKFQCIKRKCKYMPSKLDGNKVTSSFKADIPISSRIYVRTHHAGNRTFTRKPDEQQ